MGDHTDETSSQLQSPLNEYSGQLTLDNASLAWIFDHTDCFVRQSRLNEIAKFVVLYPYSFDSQGDYFWDKEEKPSEISGSSRISLLLLMMVKMITYYLSLTGGYWLASCVMCDRR
jgi:hypothetical protein